MIYLKEIGLWIIKHISIVLAVILALWLWDQYRLYHNSGTQITTTKEKEVNEIHHYHEVPNVQPITIHNQIKIDSTFRLQMEKETINTGVKVEPGKVDIQSVDPDGKVSEKEYKVPEGSEFTVTNKGLNIEPIPFYRQLKLYGGIEGGVNQNGLTNISPQLILTSPTGWALNGSYNVMDNSKNVGVSKIIRLKKK